MNKRYLFEGKTTKAIVEYGEDKNIVKVEFSSGELDAKDWFLKNVPLHTEDLLPFADKHKTRLKVTEMPPDVSFARFWDLYDYKIGKKEKVIQLWQALSEVERVKVLASIPKYKHWLAVKPNMERLYPQTFLSQRRWENDFRV